MSFKRLLLLFTSSALLASISTVRADDDAVLALGMINKARQAQGVSPLAWNSDLSAYAQYWANQMASGSQPFSHAPPDLRPKQGETIYEHVSTQDDGAYNNPLQTAVQAWLSQGGLWDGQPIRDGNEPWLHWCKLSSACYRFQTWGC